MMTTRSMGPLRRRARVLLALVCLVPALAFGAPTLDQRLTAVADLGRFVPETVDARLRALEAETRRAPLSTRAEFLFQSSMVRRTLGKQDEALALAAELERLARTTNDSAALSRAFLARAAVFNSRGQYKEAAALTSEAERAAAASGDEIQRVRTLVATGVAHAEAGNLVQAMAKVQEAALLARGIETTTAPLVEALASLASLYDDVREYQKGFETLDEAWALAAAMDSPTHMATLKAIEYSVAVNSKQNDRAIRALLVGEEQSRRAGATRLLAITLINLSDVYLRKGNYDNVIRYASEGVAISLPLGDKKAAAAGQVNLGQAYMATGQVALGKRHFETGMEYYEQGGDKRELQLVLVEYGNALEKAGDIDAANKAYHRERDLSNELFEAQRQKLMIEMQEKYDTEKRQREILRLNEENFAKSAELQQRRLQQRIWWLLALVFALAAVIVGLLYRRVRQANALLQVKNLELKAQSSLDPLTGLFNRRHFQDYIREHGQPERRANGNAASGEELVGALFLLDVDHFKHINDQYGHAAGDAVLKMIAESLREILRETDMIVRWGGEEFLAFLPAIPRAGLDEVARRILSGIAARSITCQGATIGVTVSVGFAPYPLAAGNENLPWERVVNLVDMALYLSKSAGRNRAHGVKRLPSMPAPDALERVEQDLEGAWRAGLAELTMVLPHCPMSPRAATAADSVAPPLLVAG